LGYDRNLNLFGSGFAGLGSPQFATLKDRERLAYEYFVNRLYVALSRARSRLLIVDTREAMAHFWGFARGGDHVRLIEQYKNDARAWKPSDLGSISAGQNSSWSESGDDPKDLGIQYFDTGRDNRDAYTLDRAEQKFRSAGEKGLATQALAWACHFRDQYREAGEHFEEVGDTDQSLKNYWLGSDYQAYVTLAKRKKRLTTLEGQLAQFMAGHRSPQAASTLFGTLFRLCQQPSACGDDELVSWKSCLDTALATLIAGVASERTESAPSSQDYMHVSEVARTLGWKCNTSLDFAVFAALGGDAHAAVVAWEILKRPSADAPVTILSCLAEVKPFPENIPHLVKMGNLGKVVEEVRAGDSGKLSSGMISEIAGSLWVQGQFDLLNEFVLTLKPHRAMLIIDGIADINAAQDEALKILAKLIQRLGESGEWKALFEVLSKGNVPELSPSKKAWLIRQLGDLPDLHASIIRNIARSVDLQDTDLATKKYISDYLERMRIKKEILSKVSPQRCPAVIQAEAGKLAHETASAPLYADNGIV
jgi:hypothetical protein